MRGADAWQGNASAANEIGRAFGRVSGGNSDLFVDDLPIYRGGVAGAAGLLAERSDG